MKPAVFVILFCLLAGTFLYYRIQPLSATVRINETTFFVELALTGKEIEKGLSGRSNLPSKHGMLFLFNHKEKYPFWMKDMRFPLDFVWMDGNLIVDITKNVPLTENGVITRLQPNVPVDKILELSAGEIDAAGIQIGDTALFNK